jgi:hypothetical protein
MMNSCRFRHRDRRADHRPQVRHRSGPGHRFRPSRPCTIRPIRAEEIKMKKALAFFCSDHVHPGRCVRKARSAPTSAEGLREGRLSSSTRAFQKGAPTNRQSFGRCAGRSGQPGPFLPLFGASIVARCRLASPFGKTRRCRGRE